MSAFLHTLAQATLAMSAVIALLLLALPALSRRCSARSVSLVFLIVFVGLLVPWRLWPARPVAALTLPVPVPVSAPVSADEYPAVQPTARRTLENAAWRTEETPDASAAQGAAKKARPSAATLVFLVWAAGAAGVLLWNLCGYARFRRTAGRWARPIADERCREALRQARRSLGVKKTVRLRYCPAVGSPMLVGTRRPMILLPDTKLTERELALVLRHELTHLKRRDIPRRALALTACALHWFNPLVWMAARMQVFYCEAACDERVLRGADLDERQYYSETIIAVIRRRTGPRTALSTSFYGGKKSMKKRIAAIMSLGRKRLSVLLVAVALTLTLGAGLCFALTTDETPTAGATPAPAAVEPSAALPVVYPAGLDEASAVALAEDECLARIGWDFGVKGFARSGEIRYGTIDWHGETVSVLEVPLTATLGDGSEYLHNVKISMDTAEVIRIDVSGQYADGTAYENSGYRPAKTQSLGLTMWVASPISGAANLCLSADDYEWPAELLFNGVQVTVHETLPTLGGYPHELLADPDEMWARVTVGATGSYAGAEGYVPLVCLTDAQPDAALPVGTIVTDQATGYVGVLANNGLSRETMGTLSAGTQVELLGRTNTYWHIRAGKAQGFVPLENVELGAEALAALESAQVRGYDEVQPGWQTRYEEYQAQLTTLYNRYGDPSEWPLEARAQASQLALDNGFMWLSDRVCILPGEGDMTEAEAVRRATDAAMEAFAFSEEDVEYASVSFHYMVNAPQERLWKISLQMRDGFANCSVTLNAAGEVQETWQSGYVNRSASADAEETPARGTIDYYIASGGSAERAEGDMTREEALEKARALLIAAWPDGENETFAETAVLREDGSERWWLVTLAPETVGVYGEPDFCAALICPDGAQVYTVDAQAYAKARAMTREWEAFDAKREALEKQRGPYAAWTLEQKAEMEPDIFGLPGEKDMTQEKAVQTARGALTEKFGLTDAELDALIVCPYFYRDGRWRIDFHTEETLAAGEDGYEVWMDSQTGAFSDWADVVAPGMGNG